MTLQDNIFIQNIQPCISQVIHRICTPEWKIEDKNLPVHNFMLVYEGEMLIGYGDKEYRVPPMHFIYFKPGDKRWLRTDPDNLAKAYAVNFIYTCQILRGFDFEHKDIILPFDTVQKISDNYVYKNLLSSFDMLSKSWISGKENYILTSRVQLLEIIGLLLSWKRRSQEKSCLNYKKMEIVNNIVDYMTSHYGDEDILNAIAEELHFTVSYLGSLFKKATGKTLIEYLTSIKINRAKDLLKDGFSVTEVSQMIGFNDVYYFSKCFTKHQGVSPSKYKSM